MNAAWKQIVTRTELRLADPNRDAIASLLRDFKSDWALRILPRNRGTRGNPLAVTNVAHSQLCQVASSQLTVDCQVKHREGTWHTCDLEPYADHPDLFQLQRRVLPSELPFVPQHARGASVRVDSMTASFPMAGSFSLNLRRTDAVRPVAPFQGSRIGVS